MASVTVVVLAALVELKPVMDVTPVPLANEGLIPVLFVVLAQLKLKLPVPLVPLAALRVIAGTFVPTQLVMVEPVGAVAKVILGAT